MDRAIIFFSRVPIAGTTKTRLQSYYSAEQCALIHKALLQSVFNAVKASDIDYFIFIDPIEKSDTMKTILGESNFFSQYGENLNKKMFDAFGRVFLKNYKEVLLLGSDLVNIDSKYIHEAFDNLKHFEVVIGPTEDGGYGLVAMKKPYKEIFDEQESGHENVLKNILIRLDNKNISYKLLDKIRDIDTVEDIDEIIGDRNINTVITRIKGKYEKQNN